MARRQQSPLVEEIHRLLDECQPYGPSSEVRGRWQEIWREFNEGDRLGEADIETAGAVLLFGRYLKETEHNFVAAARLLSIYLTHPQIDKGYQFIALPGSFNIAYWLLKSGNEREALAFLYTLIDHTPGRHNRSALKEAEVALTCFCWERRDGGMASAELTEIAHEVVHRLRRRKVRRWQPGARSFQQILEILREADSGAERRRTMPRIEERRKEPRQREEAEPRN